MARHPASPTRSHLHREDGMGLVIALLVLAIVSALGATVIAGNMADLQISTNYANRSIAFYAADSGIEVTARDLKADRTWIDAYIDPLTWQAVSPLPNPVTINGEAVSPLAPGDDSPGYWNLGSQTTLGDGAYTRQILLPPDPVVTAGDGVITFTVRATGTGGVIDSGQQVVRANIALDVEGHGVWDNAVFAGDGASGNQINGNVAIRGSMHVVGDPNNPSTINFGGTADIRNNYADAVTDFGATDAAKLPPLPLIEHNGEMVESLESIIRLQHADIALDGTADLGLADVTGNGYKETLDKVRADGSITPASDVHADDWDDYDAEGVSFPGLDEPYLADDGTSWTSHRDYLDTSALVISETEISPNVSSFSHSDANGNSITWNQSTETLTITGIVKVDANLQLGKNGGATGTRGFEYAGTGTLYSPHDITIKGPVVPEGGYLADGNLGIIAGTDVNIQNTSHLNIFAAIYADQEVNVAKQTTVGGAVVTRSFDIGTNVPRIYQVPDLSTNLPPGMPGNRRIAVIARARVTDWFQER